MPDTAPTSPGTWAIIVGTVMTGLAALVGVLNSWRQAPFQNRLITAQAESAEEAKGRTQLDGITAAGKYVLEALEDSRHTIDRLRGERDTALLEVKLLKAENESLWQQNALLREMKRPDEAGPKG